MIDLELTAKVYDASTPRKTKEDVIEYYKAQYPGFRTDKKGKRIQEWVSKLSDALVGIATDKNGKPLKKASIMRRFQGSRAESSKVSPKVAKEYEQLGKQLPPIPPTNGYRIVGTVCVSYSEECEERDVDITIKGEDAWEFVLNPTMQRIVNLYNEQNLDEDEPMASPCEDDAEEDGCRAKLSIY